MGPGARTLCRADRWDPAGFDATQDAALRYRRSGSLSCDLRISGAADGRNLPRHHCRATSLWFYTLAGALTDDQLRATFRASGATAEEVEQFTAAMRGRLEKLREVSGQAPTP